VENKVVKISFYADEELRTRLKLACTAQNLSMNEVLTGLVKVWVEENDPFKKGRKNDAIAR
jgi:hypothetical protein